MDRSHTEKLVLERGLADARRQGLEAKGRARVAPAGDTLPETGERGGTRSHGGQAAGPKGLLIYRNTQRRASGFTF